MVGGGGERRGGRGAELGGVGLGWEEEEEEEEEEDSSSLSILFFRSFVFPFSPFSPSSFSSSSTRGAWRM